MRNFFQAKRWFLLYTANLCNQSVTEVQQIAAILAIFYHCNFYLQSLHIFGCKLKEHLSNAKITSITYCTQKMHFYRKISIYAILVTLFLIIPGSSPSRAWEFGVKGHGFEPYRFIVISSSRMHLKGANIAANIFQIYNRYSCSICNLKLQILHQKLAAAKSCT